MFSIDRSIRGERRGVVHDGGGSRRQARRGYRLRRVTLLTIAAMPFPPPPPPPAEVQREEEKMKREIKQYAKKDPAIVKMLAKNIVRALRLM
jgi:hypothetical protein